MDVHAGARPVGEGLDGKSVPEIVQARAVGETGPHPAVPQQLVEGLKHVLVDEALPFSRDQKTGRERGERRAIAQLPVRGERFERAGL